MKIHVLRYQPFNIEHTIDAVISTRVNPHHPLLLGRQRTVTHHPSRLLASLRALQTPVGLKAAWVKPRAITGEEREQSLVRGGKAVSSHPKPATAAALRQLVLVSMITVVSVTAARECKSSCRYAYYSA